MITAERPRYAVPRLLPCGNCEIINALSHCICGNLLCSNSKQICGLVTGRTIIAGYGLCYAGHREPLTIFEQRDLRKLRVGFINPWRTFFLVRALLPEWGQ